VLGLKVFNFLQRVLVKPAIVIDSMPLTTDNDEERRDRIERMSRKSEDVPAERRPSNTEAPSASSAAKSSTPPDTDTSG
jgi:hypothetical protein